jgi:hypothetical protein
MPWAPDYVSADELAEQLRIGDDVDDVQLALAATAASRAVDGTTHRQFGLADTLEVREYTARWSRTRGAWLVPVDDLMDLTGFAVTVDLDGDGAHEATVDPAMVVKLPRNAAAKGRPYERLLIPAWSPVQPTGVDGAVAVTARPGWTAVPDTVKQATLLQGARFAARRDAPFGVAGSPEAGSELRLLARVDPDVAVTLAGYRRKVWAR